MHHGVWVCQADDDVEEVLASMRAHRVRRLPVLDEKGELVGIVSMTGERRTDWALHCAGRDADNARMTGRCPRCHVWRDSRWVASIRSSST
jgi:CBS-domain-containing membrane protein